MPLLFIADPILVAALAVFVGLWRWWDGRGADGWPAWARRANGKAFSGAAYVQAAIVLAGVGALEYFVGHKAWELSLIAGLAVLVLTHIAGHTPILYPPGAIIPAADISGLEKDIWIVASGVPTNELKWWAFGFIRYVCVATSISIGVWGIEHYRLHIESDQFRLGFPICAFLMLIVYRVTTIPPVDAFLMRIAPFYKSSGHIQYAEFFGWMFIGAGLAVI